MSAPQQSPALSELDIAPVLDDFYRSVRRDDLLGPICARDPRRGLAGAPSSERRLLAVRHTEDRAVSRQTPFGSTKLSRAFGRSSSTAGCLCSGKPVIG